MKDDFYHSLSFTQKKLEKGVERRKTIGLIVAIVAIVSVVCKILAGLCLLAIDSIVHGALYHYGLQFSTDWANPYWLIIRVCFSLLVIIMVLASIKCLFNRSAVKTWNDLLRTASTRVTNLKKKKSIREPWSPRNNNFDARYVQFHERKTL